MPILTPWADVGPANKRPPTATAINNPDFILSLPENLLLRPWYFITLRLPIYFKLSNSIGASRGTDRTIVLSSAGGRRLFCARRAVGQTTDHDVEDRREDQAEQGHADHAEEHGNADRLTHFGSRAR